MITVVRSNFTTGGHSNTDHQIAQTGDRRVDRIAELKRNMLRRSRSMQPEHKGSNRYVDLCCVTVSKESVARRPSTSIYQPSFSCISHPSLQPIDTALVAVGINRGNLANVDAGLYENPICQTHHQNHHCPDISCL